MGVSFNPKDFTLPAATPSNKASSNFNPADFAIPDTSQMATQESQGFFSSLFNRAANLPWVLSAKAQNAIDQQQANPSIGGFIKSGLLAPFGIVGKAIANNTGEANKEYLATTLANVKQADANYSQGSNLALSDLGNLFGRVKDSWDQFVGNTARPAVDPNVSQDNFFTALGKGLVNAFAAPIDALIGVDMTKPYNPAFTPEQEADKIKQGIALGVSMMLTPAAGALVKGIGAGAITAGITEGAVGGVSFGAVAGANKDDQVNQMFQGLVMAPLGAAFEVAGKLKGLGKVKNELDVNTGVDVTKPVQDQAYALANTKQLMFDENKSTMDLVSNAANLADSKSLDEALVKSMVNNNPDQPFLVRGDLSPESINTIGDSRIISSINPDNQVHLILPKDVELESTPTNIFKQTGFLPEQNVLVNGKAYEFGNIAPGGKAYVIDNADKSYLVDLKDVQHPSDFTLAKFNDDYSINPKVGTASELYNNYKRFASGSGGVTVKRIPQTQVQASQFTLPPSLIKSTPKYGYGNALFDVGFSSDFNKAAYILAGSGRSKAHAAFENAIVKAGFDMNDVIAHGNIIRRDLKLQAKSLKSQGIFRGAIKNETQFTPSNSIANGIPKVDVVITPRPFEDVVRGYMNHQGFGPESFDAISNTLQNQIRLEALGNMSPSELKDYHLALNHEVEVKSGDLANQIQASGLNVDYNGSGGITLRDNKGNVVVNVGSSTELSEFLAKSGGQNGIKLDSNFVLPAEITGLDMLNDPKGKLLDAKADRWEQAYGGAVSSVPVFADRSSYFNSVDARWGTNISTLFQQLQARKLQISSRAKPLHMQLQGIAKSLGKITDVRLKLLYQAMDTASPGELELRSTPLEVAAAKSFGGKDIKNEMNFVYQRNRILDDKTLDNDGKEIAIKTLTAALNPDKKFVASIDGILTAPPADAKLGSVARLARAYANSDNALSRTDFMAKYNFSNAEVNAVRGMSSIMDRAAGIFGIDKDDQIFNYITHKKLYDPLEASPTLFNSNFESGQFNSDLLRTGLVTNLNENPFNVINSYLNEGFDKRFFQPLVDQNRSLFENELVKNANTPSLAVPNIARPQLLKQFDMFLNDIRGRQPDANKYTYASINTILRKLPGLSKADISDWGHTLNKSLTYATQAFIPGKGVRDFATNYFNGWAKLGSDRMVDVLRYAKDPAAIKNLLDRGLIEEFVSIDYKTISEEKAIESSLYHKIGEAGIKYTFQEPINTAMRGGFFLESYNRTLKYLKNLDVTNAGEVSQAYKDIEIGKELKSIQNAFDRYVKNEKFEEAARFLAQYQVNDIIGSYTLGNQPAMWNTNIGKLAGKYGTWSVHQMNYLARSMARGSAKDKVLFATRMAATQAGLGAIAAATGLNMNSYSAIKGVMFTGSPYLKAGQLLLDSYGGDQDKINFLKRLVPIDKDGKIRGSLVVPGSAGVAQWLEVINRAFAGEFGTAGLEAISGSTVRD